MRCAGWCGQCYANRKGRSNYKGHAGYIGRRPETWSDYHMFVKRASGSGKPGDVGASLDDAAFKKDFPALFEHVSLMKWEDGKNRKLTTMLFFVEDGRWKLMLNDKDGGLIAFLASDTFHGLLDLSEMKLQDGTVEWRRQKPQTGRR